MKKRIIVTIMIALFTVIGIYLLSNPMKKDPNYYINSGAFVKVQSNIYNENILREYFTPTGTIQKDKLRVVSYTVEGDPIIYDISYNEMGYLLKIDSSQDKYGSKKIIKSYYENMLMEEKDGYTSYYLYNGSFDEIIFKLSDSDQYYTLVRY